jgi:hypothetical protein
MTWWLHVTVIYPLAAVGAAVIAGVVFLVTAPGDRAWVEQACASCGTAGKFQHRGLQGGRLCDACWEGWVVSGGER